MFGYGLGINKAFFCLVIWRSGRCLSSCQDWMQDQGRDEEEIQSVIHGFKRALGRELLPSIAFGDFARQFQWFTKTLKVGVWCCSIHRWLYQRSWYCRLPSLAQSDDLHCMNLDGSCIAKKLIVAMLKLQRQYLFVICSSCWYVKPVLASPGNGISERR